MADQQSNPPEDSEDNFGLPEIDYKPLDRDIDPVVSGVEEVPAGDLQEIRDNSESTDFELSEEREVASTHERVEEEIPLLRDEPEEKRSTPPVVLGLIIVTLVVVSALLVYFFVYKPKAENALAEKVENEKKIALKAQAKQDSLARIEEEKKILEAEKNALAAKPTLGTIETLSGNTQLYYVIITSNIDDDLVMDFAKKLSLKGTSTKIIPPFGKSEYYRLAISNQDTYAKAKEDADSAKAEFGDNIWVLKY
jgi:hypothetical protein